MEVKKFFEYAEEEWKQEKKLMEDKGVEYTMSNADKLKNFKVVAELLSRVTAVDTVMTYLLKHFFSIINYVNTGQAASDEPIEGRIRDARNYLLFLGALLKEDSVPPDPITSTVSYEGYE